MPLNWIQSTLNALWFVILPISEFVSKLGTIPDLTLRVQVSVGIYLLLFGALVLFFLCHTAYTGQVHGLLKPSESFFTSVVSLSHVGFSQS